MGVHSNLDKQGNVAHGPQDDALGTHPSFVRSQAASLRFAAFVDNMGEDLSHGFDIGQQDGEWDNNDNADIAYEAGSKLATVPAIDKENIEGIGEAAYGCAPLADFSTSDIAFISGARSVDSENVVMTGEIETVER
ncbi:hypothetical protein CERSUDRAFT_75816 [Gelatoporia subvermispora B]|uniref:Uncharacterized protein n=1 Tax=Ceriporiopsis subvermispora (strain B) TaxID=914234 RepID=M2QB54_CERS8|nr:hypothetical protein CERSUDRAFT_75816 [Gelatoporia subvermispora B]